MLAEPKLADARRRAVGAAPYVGKLPSPPGCAKCSTSTSCASVSSSSDSDSEPSTPRPAPSNLFSAATSPSKQPNALTSRCRLGAPAAHSAPRLLPFTRAASDGVATLARLVRIRPAAGHALEQSVAMRRSATAAAGLHEQRRVFVLIYAAYVGLLVARKNYGFWIPHAMAVLSLEKKDVAVIGSSFEMASGYGALLNGFLIDTFDPALGLAAALGLSALVNACLARASSLETMALLWGVNGVAQSFGWPCVSRLFLRAFPEPKGRGLWYSLLSTSQNVGAALVPILVTAASAATADARAAFLLPAALSAALCVTLLCTLTPMRDAPAPAAPAPPADHSPPSSPPPSSPLAAPSSAWAELGGVLGNWRLWVMAADYFTIGIVRSCLTDWTPMYLAEEKGLGVAAASRCLCVFELGGFLGSIAAGRLSDRACGGRRGPVIASCTVLLCPALLALGALRGEPALLAIYFALGALAFPVHVLLGLASREIVSPTASSTAGGLVKFVAQMGASSAGYPLGLLQRAHGWQAVLALLSALSCAGGLVASSLWLTVARVDEERAAARSGQQLHKRKGG